MFEMESRGELVEKIEDLVNRKRYTELRDLLLPLEPADIAILADDLDDEKTLPLLFRLLPKEQAAEVFVELESDQQELLIRGFSNTELKEVLDELYLDDAVDIVEEMPASVVIRILDKATPEMRKSINEMLKYPEDSAGALMTTEFVDLKRDMTVEDAFKRIRRIAAGILPQKIEPKVFNQRFVQPRGIHLIAPHNAVKPLVRRFVPHNKRPLG